MDPNIVLDVTDLTILYESKFGSVRALDSLSISIEPNRLIAVVGESGCGKTTLGLSIIGLLPSYAKVMSGGVSYKGVSLLDLGQDQIRSYRGTEIAMIFQEPISSLNPVYRIGSQIDEAISIRQSRSRVASAFDRSEERLGQSRGRVETRKRAIDALNRVRIPDPEHIMNRYPFELSGGMIQRVMIAMALVEEPSLLIADEPTTALDVTTQAQVLKLMRNLMDTVRTSILLITHDLAVAAQVADRIAVMYGGQMVEEADVLELFSHPLHPYTQGLLGCIPLGPKETSRLRPIPGNVLDLRKAPRGCKFAPRCQHVMEWCWEKKTELNYAEGHKGHKVACHLHERA